MNKLIAVESSRCLSIVADCIETLENINNINPNFLHMNVNFEGLFGREFTSVMQQYIQSRTQLEALINELTTVKLSGFRTKIPRLQRRIATAESVLDEAVHKLVLAISDEPNFISKLESVGLVSRAVPAHVQSGGATEGEQAAQQVEEQPQPVQATSGAGNDAGAGGNQFDSSVVEYKSVNDLISTLKALYEVTNADLHTSISQLRRRKEEITNLERREKKGVTQLQSLKREYDVTMEQSNIGKKRLMTGFDSLHDQLSQNSLKFLSIVQKLSAESDVLSKNTETTAKSILKGLDETKEEMEKNLLDTMRTHKEGIQDLQRLKRRALLEIDRIKKNYDERLCALDNKIYKYKHEINICNDRLKTLKIILEDYYEYKRRRDAKSSDEEEQRRLHLVEWTLDPICYEMKADEFD